MWIIGDCQGEFDTVLKVVSQIPKDERIIFVGDIVDRGPKSRELVKFVRDGNYTCLLGNHEHMLIDFLQSRNPVTGPMYYEPENYYYNGGCATLKSYIGQPHWQDGDTEGHRQLKNDIEWMKSLPLKLVFDDLIITHAPLVHGEMWEEWMEKDHRMMPDLIWNRDHIKPNEKFQIFGHNGKMHVFNMGEGSRYTKSKTYAMCIDDTRMDKITAIHWPSLDIIQKKYTQTDGEDEEFLHIKHPIMV